MARNAKRATTRPESLPSFKKPPINEVVCGFRYEPLQAMRVPHIGILWERFRKDYPVAQHATPIASETSILIDPSTGAPIPRIWFVNEQDDQLLQFQSDRFYFNWRERKNAYPRYSTIIAKFESAKLILEHFLNEFQLGPLVPIEYDLTYINQLPKGKGWETNDDLNKVFCDFNWQRLSGRFLPNPSNTTWQTRFPLPDESGWLTAKLNQGKRRDDDTPVLMFELAARGLSGDKSDNAMRRWFDLAHVWIVRGFADLTTSTIQHSVWEREDDSTG